MNDNIIYYMFLNMFKYKLRIFGAKLQKNFDICKFFSTFAQKFFQML